MTLVLSVSQHSRDPQPSPKVREAQQDLVRRGYSVGASGADGVFGHNTEMAVIRFQAHNGLTPDGIIGSHTWPRLHNVPVVQPKPKPAPKPNTQSQASAVAAHVAARCQGIDGHARLQYQFGYEITNLATPYPARADCSEIIQWGVYQAVRDSWIDGSKYQYAGCHHISVAAARNTPGALVFLSDGGPSSIHHVGIVYHHGSGVYAAQARSAHLSPECGVWEFDSMSWKYAGLIPVLRY